MMQQAIWVEQASPADAEEITSLIEKLLDEIVTAVGAKVFSFDAAQAESQLRRLIDLGRYVVFVARESGDRIVGVVTLSESSALYAGGLFGTIPEFYVVPERRSMGVGSMLAAASQAYAQFHGWQRLEVTTPPLPQFEKTLSFYERQGFLITGGRKLKLETQP
ncbi:GNAT family N-acetyltransferase [Ferrovum sp.]|uniref:GNAT family N-acetyltransferase n=1 Tax=Ferrovum sp. TaxID=2609467 RepID=UPI00261C3D6F|nr:GNAT family N-acetyltransferase [Ferrovum sp.]